MPFLFKLKDMVTAAGAIDAGRAELIYETIPLIVAAKYKDPSLSHFKAFVAVLDEVGKSRVPAVVAAKSLIAIVELSRERKVAVGKGGDDAGAASQDERHGRVFAAEVVTAICGHLCELASQKDKSHTEQDMICKTSDTHWDTVCRHHNFTVPSVHGYS